MDEPQEPSEPRATAMVGTGRTAAPESGPVDEVRIPTEQLLQLSRGSLTFNAEQVTTTAIQARQLSESYATISVVSGLAGVLGGLFVVWMLPFSIGAVVFAMLARGNSQDGIRSRLGLVTGLVGLGFGLVWLFYYLAVATG